MTASVPTLGDRRGTRNGCCNAPRWRRSSLIFFNRPGSSDVVAVDADADADGCPSSFARLLSLAEDFCNGSGEASSGLVSVSVTTSRSSSSRSGSSGANVICGGDSLGIFCAGSEGGWEIVITEETDWGRPVSDQLPLRAASKNGEAKKRTSLCALFVESTRLVGTVQGTITHPPECGILDNDLDRSRKTAILCESAVDSNRLFIVAKVGGREIVRYFL